MKKAKKIQDNEQSDETVTLKAQLVRALADYDNLSKRVERDRGELVQSASSRIVSQLLPILDMLEQAQKHLQDAGLAITLQQFKEVLNLEGYEEIKTQLGDGFDPEIHEAIEVVDGEGEGIAEVLQPGWRRNDGFVIRPVKVKVYKQSLPLRGKIENKNG